MEKPPRGILFKSQHLKRAEKKQTILDFHIQERQITPEMLHDFNEKGLSAVEIAKLWGVRSPNTVKAWYGKLGVPRVSRLELSLARYKVTEESLRSFIEAGKTYTMFNAFHHFCT